MKNCQGLLRKIHEYGFVLRDTNLFLDSHPDNKRALAHYYKYRDLFENAVREYEKSYGPLTTNGVNGDEWTWVDTPWPWEVEA